MKKYELFDVVGRPNRDQSVPREISNETVFLLENNFLQKIQSE